MRLQSLHLTNFRLYENSFFEFSSDENLIYGPNAQGKTTVLEAIYLLIIGRSFRTSQLKELIRNGEDFFHIEASFVKHNVQQTLRFGYNGKERKILYNASPLSSTSGLLGLIQGVLIIPDDISIVNGAPARRREFLDLQIAQMDPLYVHHLTRYMRAMRHRNDLLKRRNSASIESFETVMAHSAAYIVNQRRIAIDQLDQISQALHRELSGVNERITLSFKEDGVSNPEWFIEKFKKNRKNEMDVGYTLIGPHKDDFKIEIDNLEARYFASEGQRRNVVNTLRFAEWERMQKLTDQKPLLLIDDIGISLDKDRKKRLFSRLSGFSQVVLTSTERVDVNGKTFH